MDTADRRILRVVQEDAGLTADEIATRVGLSPSSVQRRLARLRKDRIIERTIAVVDRKAAGKTLSILVEIAIHNEQRHELERFQRWVTRSEEVQSCWYVTGEADYVLLVAAADLDEYNRFIDAMMSENSTVRKYKSSIALRTIKQGLALRID
jgi:DNA-binding Lrp family transcriptional regulator